MISFNLLKYDLNIFKNNYSYWVFISYNKIIIYKILVKSSSLIFINNFLKYCELNYFCNKRIVKLFFNQLVYNSELLFSVKLQFRRKGAWISCRRKWPAVLSLKFGHGHPVRLNSGSQLVRRYKKYLKYHSLILFDMSTAMLSQRFSKILLVKEFNLYNWRGLRAARCLLIKKRGKESQYNKLKSKIF